MARMPHMARTPRMARWLADYPDPYFEVDLCVCDLLMFIIHSKYFPNSG